MMIMMQKMIRIQHRSLTTYLISLVNLHYELTSIRKSQILMTIDSTLLSWISVTNNAIKFIVDRLFSIYLLKLFFLY